MASSLLVPLLLFLQLFSSEAAVEVDFMGELGPGRFFYFVSDAASSEAFAHSKAYVDAMYARCRDDYGGHVGWLETDAIWNAFNAWAVFRGVGANWERFFNAGRCRSTDGHCKYLLGLFRLSASTETITAALQNSRWVSDPADPSSADTSLPVGSEAPARGQFANTWMTDFGPANLRTLYCAINNDRYVCGSGYYDTTTAGWRAHYEQSGWSVVCETPRPNFQRFKWTQNFHFRETAQTELPSVTEGRVVNGSSPLRCAQECVTWTACYRFALTDGADCLLYDRPSDKDPGLSGHLYEYLF